MNQLKAGALLSYVVLGLNTAVNLFYTPYMLRKIGQSEYGLYALVTSVIAYLTILDLGFGNAIVRYTAKFRAEGKIREQYSMFGMFIILYSIIGLIALGIGLILYFNIDVLFKAKMTLYELQRAQIMMLLLCFNLAITFPFSLFGSIITAYEDFVFQKIVQIIRIVLNCVTMIVLLHLGYKAIGLVVVTTIYNLLTLFLNFIYCRYKIKIKVYFTHFNWSFLKEISIYSFYILLNAIMDRIYWSSGQFILAAVAGTTAVAIYAVAITLQQMYMSFSSAIVGVFLPKVTAMVTKHQDNQTLSDLFIRTGRIQYIVLCFILSGFILFGQQFINLWAGEEYKQAYVISLLFLLPLTVPLIQNLGVTILQARNQMKFRSILYVIIACLSLVISIPLSQSYGAIGCAIGTSGALFLGQIIIMNIYYHKYQKIDINLFWKNIFKMSILPIFLCIASYIILQHCDTLDSFTKLAAGILVFTIIYIPTFWLISMNNYERKLVLGIFQSIRTKLTPR